MPAYIVPRPSRSEARVQRLPVGIYMNKLYREELMEIYKSPKHRGQLSGSTSSTTKVNPVCGDIVTLQLLVQEDKIVDAKFSGPACSVSVISSELLLSKIIGKTIADVGKISKEDLLGLIDINLTTSRIACATLVWEALKEALATYEKKFK